MRILVYLAALAIFLFIINLGAQWLGDDAPVSDPDSAEQAVAQVAEQTATTPEPSVDAASAPALETTLEMQSPAPQTPEPDSRVDAAAQPTAAAPVDVAPVDVAPADSEQNPVETLTAAIAEPVSELDSAMDDVVESAIAPSSSQPEAVSAEIPVAETPVAVPAIAQEQTPNSAEQTLTASEPAPVAGEIAVADDPEATIAAASDSTPAPEEEGAIGRFTDSAQEVAQGAVERVADTIDSVSAAISGRNSDLESLEQPLVPDNIAAMMRRHKDRKLLVLFWHPQNESVPEAFEWLGRMQTRYGSQGLTTVAVNLSSEIDNQAAVPVAHGNNIEQRSDPERILARAFWVQEVPSIYLLDDSGALRKRIDGFDESRVGSYEDSVRASVRE